MQNILIKFRSHLASLKIHHMYAYTSQLAPAPPQFMKKFKLETQKEGKNCMVDSIGLPFDHRLTE